MVTYAGEYKQTSNSSSRGFYGYSAEPTGITIHHWGSDGQSHSGVVSWLRGAAGGTSNEGSSAHYVVSAGRVTQLESESRSTWHAGNGKGNGTTIGIEMRPEMSAGDWATLVELCVNIEQRRGSMDYFLHKDWKATACPGRYSDQLGKLISDVNAAHNGTTTTTTSNTGDWFDMATKSDLREVLRELGWGYKGSNENRDAYSYLRGATGAAEEVNENVDTKVWGYKGVDEPSDAYAYLRATRREVAAVRGELEGIVTALEQAGQVDVNAVRAAAEDGVSKALGSLEADVTLNVSSEEG